MEPIESFEQLEKSVIHARQVISELIEEAEKWKKMYTELAESVERELLATGDEAKASLSGDCEGLLKENRLLKAKLLQVIHKTENIRDRFGEILNS